MGEQLDNKKITWVIKNFTSLPSTPIYSDQFVVGGCRWRLRALVKRNEKADDTNLSLILEVPDKDSLPIGWGRHAKFSVTLVNQYSEKFSQLKETRRWFHEFLRNDPRRWFPAAFISFINLNAKKGLFLVNGELIVVAKIDVLEVEEKLEVTEESSPVMETIDVNGFQVLPSQVESVKRLFEKELDMASNIRPNNQYLKTAYMNVLLSLTQTLCQMPEEISNDDMAGAGASLTYLRDAGFKLDWLEKKHDEIKEKKKKIEACLARLDYLDETLKPYEKKCVDELKAARVPLSLYDDDVV